MLSYRFGYQGSEKDDEISGSTGSHITTKYRELDVIIARWWSIDPKSKLMPWESPYASMNNSPIYLNDPDGDCPWCLVFLGLMFTSNPVSSPTLNPEADAKANAQARANRDKMLIASFFGPALRTVSARQVVNSLGQQFALQLTMETGEQLYKGGDFDLKKAVVGAIKNVDLADALFSQINVSSLTKNIMSAAVDITPKEIKMLGIDKDVGKFTVDIVMNHLTDKLKVTQTNAKYNKVYDKVMDVINKETQKGIIKTSETNYKDLIKEDNLINKNDNTRVGN